MAKRKYTVYWDHRPPKQQVYDADDHEFAKTGSIITLLNADGKPIFLISNFMSINIDYLEEE
jgi:hypothetical protein